MYPEERRDAIVTVVTSDGRADVTELAERFQVTPETIRRDLTELESRGLVRRVHGGAIPRERARTEPAVAEKRSLHADEKARIAKAAIAFLPATGAVLVDAGTTTVAIAEQFPADRELTVITNSLHVGMTLAVVPTVNLHVLGGRVRGVTLANVGPWSERVLADLVVEVAFIGTNGFSLARGLSTPDPVEAEVKRAMVRAARQVVVVADSSKSEAEHTVRFAPLEAVDVLVTDGGLTDERAAAYEEAGVEVVRA